MNKRDIIIQVSQETGLSQANVQSAFESIIQVIKDSISMGEKITIQHFGTFQIKVFREKNVWNSWDEVYKIIPPKKVIKFKSTMPQKISNTDKPTLAK